jgi:hypothetical protein
MAWPSALKVRGSTAGRRRTASVPSSDALSPNKCSRSSFASGAYWRKKRVDRRMAGLAEMMEIRGAAQALAETK